MRKIKRLYLLDKKIKWETFKELQKRLVKNEGIICVGLDRNLWELLRDGMIYCWFCEEKTGDMGLGLKLPPHKELVILSTPKSQSEIMSRFEEK